MTVSIAGASKPVVKTPKFVMTLISFRRNRSIAALRVEGRVAPVIAVDEMPVRSSISDKAIACSTEHAKSKTELEGGRDATASTISLFRPASPAMTVSNSG